MTFLRDNWIVIAIAVVAVIAALMFLWGVWWLWWRLPQRQVTQLTLQIPDPKARADVEDNFRKTVGQALGGAAVLIGAGFALFQFLQQQKDAQDLRISNQVAKSFEQLAGSEMAMRLGGIYGLEGVMNTSEQYHQPVLEALCAFVRENTIGKTVMDRPKTDIQAVLTVIGRRKPGPGMDLTGLNIPGANLARAHMEEATLTRAHMEKATLIGADPSHADVSLAYLIDAHLSGATLVGTNLTYAHLKGADLGGTNLTGANLAFADLTDVKLERANLAGADLSNADLRNTTYLTQAQLNQACGAGAILPPDLVLAKPCPEKPVAPQLKTTP
jgi:uncharacterized protein YjbI with pentapeptide repeats